MKTYKFIIFLLLLSTYASAKVHCQTKIVGKYVTSKHYRSSVVEDSSSCMDFCGQTYQEVLQKEDGPRQIQCKGKEGSIFVVSEVFGEPLPPRTPCITKWSKTNEVFNKTAHATRSMCDHNFRVNVRYNLDTNYYQEGYDVKILWKGEQIRRQINVPRCRAELKGLSIVNNPKMSGPKESSQLCLDECKGMYDRYTQRAQGDPRMLNCYYANKKIEVFGSLGEKKECQVINMETEQVEETRSYPTASMCKSNFSKNQIFKLSQKYKGELFAMKLVYDGSVIQEYFHKVRCQYRLYGAHYNSQKSSSMIQTQQECKDFCQENFDKDNARSNGEARWATCKINNKTILDLGSQPTNKTQAAIIDRETKTILYGPWYSYTPSIAKSRYGYYKRAVINRINKDGEFHFDLHFGEDIIESYDRFGICKIDYILRGRMSGDQSKEIETQDQCQEMCNNKTQELIGNFPQYEVSTTCRYKGVRLRNNE